VRQIVTLANSQVPPGTKCDYYRKGGPLKQDCYKGVLDDESGSSNIGGQAREFTFLAKDLILKRSWVIDSEASKHLCGNQKRFITYRKISYVQMITKADCTKMDANRMGEIEIPTGLGVIRLTQVWHA